MPLGVTGNTPDSGSGESWFDPRRGNPSGRIRGRFHIASPDLSSHRVTIPETKPDDSWVVDERSLKLFAAQLHGAPAERAWYDLRREAERIALVPGFDRLITLDANAIKELPHQIDVAQRVLRQMGGRAILADEVGLGKTIEASIIYKELAIRGLARRALILTPASLVGQWRESSRRSSSSASRPQPIRMTGSTSRRPSCRTTVRARAATPRKSCGTTGTS